MFERQPESSDEEKSVSMNDEKTENEGAFRPIAACANYLQAVAKVRNEWRKWTHYQSLKRILL